MQRVQNIAFGQKKVPKSLHFSRKEIRHCGDRKENTVQKGIFKKKDLFLEKLHQTRHILRTEILKPPYLDSRLLREVAKTKQDSKFFF
jgi:hypothetical protein